MGDIFYFVEHYVPKRLFDLKKAAPEQLRLLQRVMAGCRYFIIRAPRKGGKTILVAIIAVWLVLKKQTFRVFILAGSQDQAGWLYDYCREILAPRGSPAIAEFFGQFIVGGQDGIGKSRIRFNLGGWIMYAPASEKQVNAPTADALIMDEYVLIPTNIVEEAWPMIRSSEEPMRFLLSTATAGKANTESFLDLLDDSDKLGFEKFEWGPEDCKFLQTDVANQDSDIAKLILSGEMFLTQYEGGIPKRAGRIFARTQLREAFIPLDPNNPDHLMDGTPFEEDPERRISRGEAKGGIDWGFDHDTVITTGYRELGGRLILTRQIIGNGTSPSEWADVIAGSKDEPSIKGLAPQLGVEDWFADASGAFQNQEIKDRGLRVVSRAFQHQTRGKEWMIGIASWYFQKIKLIIPDIEEFATMKDQLRKWRRDIRGKPRKGYDHCNDSLLCLCSGFNPTYYDTTDLQQLRKPESPPPLLQANSWELFASAEQGWMPDGWRDKKEELTRNPWERK